jgi:hypothetical protein
VIAVAKLRIPDYAAIVTFNNVLLAFVMVLIAAVVARPKKSNHSIFSEDEQRGSDVGTAPYTRRELIY